MYGIVLYGITFWRLKEIDRKGAPMEGPIAKCSNPGDCRICTLRHGWSTTVSLLLVSARFQRSFVLRRKLGWVILEVDMISVEL
jgi:hypothetical protein